MGSLQEQFDTASLIGPFLPVGLNICCVTVLPEADVRPALQQSFGHDSDDVGRGRRLPLPRDDARHRPQTDLRAESRPTAERCGIAAKPPPGPFLSKGGAGQHFTQLLPIGANG